MSAVVALVYGGENCSGHRRYNLNLESTAAADEAEGEMSNLGGRRERNVCVICDPGGKYLHTEAIHAYQRHLNAAFRIN